MKLIEGYILEGIYIKKHKKHIIFIVILLTVFIVIATIYLNQPKDFKIRLFLSLYSLLKKILICHMKLFIK